MTVFDMGRGIARASITKRKAHQMRDAAEGLEPHVGRSMPVYKELLVQIGALHV